MKRAKLQDMAMNQLVERFTAIGIEQDQALLRRQHAKFNRLLDAVAISAGSYFPCTIIPTHRYG
jgi:hypothetical protein